MCYHLDIAKNIERNREVSPLSVSAFFYGKYFYQPLKMFRIFIFVFNILLSFLKSKRKSHKITFETKKALQFSEIHNKNRVLF